MKKTVCPPQICGSALLLAVLVLGILGLAQTSSRNEESQAAAHMRGLNNSLLRLHGQMQQAGPNDVRLLRSQAATVIAQRAAALSKLIESNPHAALSFAFSPELLADLTRKFPKSAALLESHMTVSGSVELLIIDNADMKTSRSLARLKADGRTLNLHFATEDEANLRSGDVVQVTGVVVAYQMAVSSSTTIQSTTTSIASTTTSAPSCSTKGVQNTLVLLTTYAGTTLPTTVTPQSVQDIFFGTSGRSLDGFWKEASYGQTSAAGDVFTYNLPGTYSCGNIDQMRDDVIAAASATGVNVQNYSRIVLVVPEMACGWAGMSSVGCTSLTSQAGSLTASYGYLDSTYLGSGTDKAVELAAHELGHHLGLRHARSRGFGAEPLGPLATTGTVYEYGDSFSAMGFWSLGQYSTPHKSEELGWLTAGTNYQTVQSSGTYTVGPLETAGLNALKIQRGTGNNAWLWLEYREPLGNYDDWLAPWLPAGALIHYEDSITSPLYTDLLNFTPTDTSFSSPQLLSGQSWTDPYTNLSLSILGGTASGLTVNVNYGAVPCTAANPTITATPLNPSIYPSNSAAYALSITSNDSSGCSSNTFTLGSTQPSGWPTGFSATSVSLSPGQTASVTMTKTGPASTSPGTYAVDANAANNSYVASAMANVTVVTAPSTAITVSMPSASYTRKSTVPITATVLSGGAPAAGASVTFTLITPTGNTITQSASTGSNGTATWSYKLSPKSPAGTYSVKAQVSSGTAATSNTASFTVQ